MKLPKPYAVAVSVAVSVAIAGATASCSSTADSKPVDNSSVTLLVPNSFTSLDPAYNADLSTGVIAGMLYDRLVAVDSKTGETRGQLAKSFEITPTSARFEIPEGIVCADGKPFTAATAMRNFQRFQDPARPSNRAATAFGGPGYQTRLEGNTIEVKFAKPVAFAARKIAENIAMVCDAGLDKPDSLESTSSGTGPYVLESATTADTYELRLRDDIAAYKWGMGGGTITEKMPRKVTVRMIKDPDTAVNLVNSGRADIALLQPEAVKRVTGDVQKLDASSGSVHMLFNHRPQSSTTSPEVRLALSQLIDRKGYSQVSTNGTATEATSLTSTAAKCSAAGVVKLPSGGEDAAASTLEAAGWKRSNGTWEKNGNPLTVRMLNASEPAAGAEYLRTVMADFGMSVALDTRSGAEAVSAMREGTSWDVVLMGASGITPPLTLIQGPVPPAGNNFGAIDNPSFNAAVTAAITTGDGTDCKLWNEAEEKLFAESDLNPLVQTSLQYVSPTWSMGESTNAFYLNPLLLARR